MINEISEVTKAFSEIYFTEMTTTDRISYMLACRCFMENIKPLVAKYTDKLPEKTTFLFKM